MFNLGIRKKKLTADIERIVNGTRGEIARESITVWNEFTICKEFHQFPRAGGYEMQSPRTMEIFRIINNVLAERDKRENEKNFLKGMKFG